MIFFRRKIKLGRIETIYERYSHEGKGNVS